MPAPLSKLSLSCVSFMAIIALTACGGGGGGSSSSSSGGSSNPPTPDTTSPNVAFSPATLTVLSADSASATLTATDNVRVTSGPTVSCTNGGAFAANSFTAPVVTTSTTSVCTATASDAAGNSDEAILTVTITPDNTAPVVTFDPVTFSLESEQTGNAALTATDNVAVTSGPTVSCTNGGTFADGVFTAPTTSTTITSVCTASASDASGNSDDATLTVTVTPDISDFFQSTSDTISTDPVLGLIQLPNEPAVIAGLTRNAAGAVSAFAATATGATGVFDDTVLTAQPTLGSVGTAPLDVVRVDIDGLEDSLIDFIFLDEANAELVGLSVNADNTFEAPVTQSVPNACALGAGGGTRFFGGDGSVSPVRDDLLVGTSNGLSYVAAGFANDGINTSGLLAPSTIVATGDFCNLVTAPTGVGDTTYVVYNPTTRMVTGFEGDGDNASSYDEEFTVDLSNDVAANLTPLLIDASFTTFLVDTVYTVFDDPEAGSVLVLFDPRDATPEPVVLDLDLEAPTDILTFERGAREDAIIVSPTSEFAVYIRDADLDATRSVELINIGTGFDQVVFANGAVAFASSTQGNIIVRTLQ